MYKLLVPVVIFFSLTLSSHAMFGKGEIKIDSDFKEGYQGYLQALKEEKGWTGAFAADNDGAWGWHLAMGGDSMNRARKGAIESCNEYSSTKSCRLFARNNKIFWKWNDLPDMSFNDYKSSCKAWEKENPDSDIYCYFAISSNGTKYGSEIQSIGKAGQVAFNVENNVKAGAVADCMEQNNKKQCYLYAMKGEIIWENSQPANTSSSPVESTKSAESGLSNSSTKEKLLELKTLLNDGLISQDEYDKKRSEILDSL
jgi:hypothetical protein